MTNQLKEGTDYYINEAGLFVFTEKYHLDRGYCCKSGCRHCPYGFNRAERKKSDLKLLPEQTKKLGF